MCFHQVCWVILKQNGARKPMAGSPDPRPLSAAWTLPFPCISPVSWSQGVCIYFRAWISGVHQGPTCPAQDSTAGQYIQLISVAFPDRELVSSPCYEIKESDAQGASGPIQPHRHRGSARARLLCSGSPSLQVTCSANTGKVTALSTHWTNDD